MSFATKYPHYNKYEKGIDFNGKGVSTSYVKQVGRELILGSFNDGEMSGTGMAGNVLIGFIPIVGQIADVRDTLASIKGVVQSPASIVAWGGLGLALICWIPGMDALKTLKFAKKGKRKISLARKIKRFIWEDRKTFNASRDFFKRFEKIFGKNHGWSKEHLLLKQRFYRSSSKDINKHSWLLQKFPSGSKMNRFFQGLGDAGWNVIPVPMKFNRWLFNNPGFSAIFSASIYAGAFFFIKGSIYLGRRLGDWMFGMENPHSADSFDKAISIDKTSQKENKRF